MGDHSQWLPQGSQWFGREWTGLGGPLDPSCYGPDKVNARTLNLVWKHRNSQHKLLSTGIVWYRLSVPINGLAAAYCTSWSFWTREGWLDACTHTHTHCSNWDLRLTLCGLWWTDYPFTRTVACCALPRVYSTCSITFHTHTALELLLPTWKSSRRCQPTLHWALRFRQRGCPRQCHSGAMAPTESTCFPQCG